MLEETGMAEIIRLRTCAENVCDYRSIDITEYIKGFTADEAQLQKDITRMLRAYGRREETDVVSEGDTVTLNCASKNPRFSKNEIPVVIGRGLFSRELEKELVGKKTGHSYVISVEDTPVEVTVMRCIHTVLPELSDESIASLGMEGISSVRELKKRCLERQIEGFILEDETPDMASAYVWQQVAKDSIVKRDPEEEKHVKERAHKRVIELREDMKDENEEDRFEPDDQMLENIFLSELDLAAVGTVYAERENRLLTEDDYEDYIEKLHEAYPEKTVEQLRAENDKEIFAISSYADILANMIDGYVAECFKTRLTEDI